MSMVVYEPPSGWNLPPGCFEGDPNAPWNQELAGKSMADAANKAVDWALDHLKDGDEIACEHFKP